MCRGGPLMGGSAHQVQHGFVESLPAQRCAIARREVHAGELVARIEPPRPGQEVKYQLEQLEHLVHPPLLDVR